MKSLTSPKLLVIVKRLWREHIRQYWKKILVIAILLIISSAATSAQPMLVQEAFDKIFKQQDKYYLIATPAKIVGVFFVQAMTLYFSNLLMGTVTNGMIADMRKRLFRHAIDNEIEFYQKVDSGSLLSRMISEIVHITSAISNFFNAWCRQFVTAVGLLGVMLYQSVPLTLASLVVFVVAFYPLRRITVRLKKLSRQLNERTAALNSRLMESTSGIRTVKAFRKEEFEIEKISGYIDSIKASSNKNNMVSIITVPMLQILSGVAVAFVIWFGGRELMAGHITVENLIAFITALMLFARPVRSLSNAGGTMVKGTVGAERYYDIIDSRPKYISREHGDTLQIAQAEIVFTDVEFSYPNGMQALKGVSFTAPAGKKTALVGHSGSGKSTLFNLLLKFYEPTSGQIMIDGQAMDNASIDSVRQNIALVSQDIFVFDETAMNNIGYGREGATEEQIIAAAKAAHCHDFIMQLPQGYQTKLGFAGESLSGGQKQRIAIARAFLRDAPILLLDEATSALDPKTEADIQSSLEILSKNRTTIIIAHRLSTVSHADQMILMEAGQVAATGTHETLFANSQTYRNHFGL